MTGARSYDLTEGSLSMTSVFGERTDDVELVRWCLDDDAMLVTNNGRYFESLSREHDSAGSLRYRTHRRPDGDPEEFARTVTAVFEQYDRDDPGNEVVDLREWRGWLRA